MRAAADTLKPVLLELGGKNALIVYPDADVDKADRGRGARHELHVGGPDRAARRSRLFVHESIHDRVLDGVVETAPQAAQARHPDRLVDHDGLRSSAARSSTRSWASSKSACDEGARLVTGGKQPDDPALAGRLLRRADGVRGRDAARCGSRAKRSSGRSSRSSSGATRTRCSTQVNARRLRAHVLDLDARPRHRASRGPARRGGLRVDQQRERAFPRRAVRRLQAVRASGARRASRSCSSSRRSRM